MTLLSLFFMYNYLEKLPVQIWFFLPSDPKAQTNAKWMQSWCGCHASLHHTLFSPWLLSISRICSIQTSHHPDDISCWNEPFQMRFAQSCALRDEQTLLANGQGSLDWMKYSPYPINSHRFGWLLHGTCCIISFSVLHRHTFSHFIHGNPLSEWLTVRPASCQHKPCYSHFWAALLL